MQFQGTSIQGRGAHDHKILNEELILAIVGVARLQPQHAADLFGVSLGLAVRLAALSDSQLDDITTASVALWRPAFTAQDLHDLPVFQPTSHPTLEIHRPVLERLNRLALATLIRHGGDPLTAALVCDITDPRLVAALNELPAFVLTEWSSHPGRPLVGLRLSEPVIDRLLRADGEPVDAELRALIGLTQAGSAQHATLLQSIEAARLQVDPASAPPPPKRSGRPNSHFLMPGTVDLILTMLRHQMRPSEVEERLLATTDVRAAQLRGVAEALNPRPRREKGAPRDRSRDQRDLWGSAQRRLAATAIFCLRERLVASGHEPFEAMVRAFDYYVGTWGARSGVSLTRMLRDVHSALRVDGDTRLAHCERCGIVHLCHEEKAGIIECPVCVLARAGRYGARRQRLLPRTASSPDGLGGDPSADHPVGHVAEDPVARPGIPSEDPRPASGAAGLRARDEDAEPEEDAGD